MTTAPFLASQRQIVTGVPALPDLDLDRLVAVPGVDAKLAQKIAAFAAQGIALGADRVAAPRSDFWAGLAAVGTRPWLDTGDIEAAEKLWCSSNSALTTNNTLLNKEVQKGIYDSLVHDAKGLLAGVDLPTTIIEIAFILNARHGLRLASRFGGKVSVELHTDLAHDVARSVAYGIRYWRICPEQFIVKIPLTAAGLIATRHLRALGIPVNFTLGFSARQNYLAAMASRPSYVNVFLGRLNAYVSDNKLGDGVNVGEKATLASQRAVRAASLGRLEPTLQIAASMRTGAQIHSLAGTDVFTMPTAAAAEALKIAPAWANHTAEDPRAQVDASARPDVLWDLDDAVSSFASDLSRRPAGSPVELLERARQQRCGDLFPELSPEQMAQVRADGKIPKHATWAGHIARGTLAIDSILNLAALESFTLDQAALDERIQRFLK